MNADRFRTLVLAFPEAVESAHMGHPDFRVRKKIFATLTADESKCAVKCDPGSLDALVRSDPETYRDAWGGRWLGIDLSRAREPELVELLEDGWRLVAPKRLAAAYTRRDPTAPGQS